MMKLPVDQTIHDLLTNKLKALEKHFKSDVISYFGPIMDGNETFFLQVIEQLNKTRSKNNCLYIILTTQGGSAFAVERYVNIVRNHYDEVNFIVPDYAYSAGTIFCLSGNNIHMDYFSVLGPIDPQVQNKEGKWVPALGYLDKVNEMLEKARENLQKGHYVNVEFKKGDVEDLPIEDSSIDVIISNCVINLAPDKAKVFKEAYRVLKVGGRLMVSDVVLIKPLPNEIRSNKELLVGCVSGAILKQEYLRLVEKAGFINVTVHKETSAFLEDYAVSITYSAFKL